MTNPDRVMQVLKYAFVVSGLLFVAVAYKIPLQSSHSPGMVFETILVLMALSSVIAGFFAPARLFSIMSRTQQSRTATPLGQWMSANILSLACFEACTLSGFALHAMGGRTRIVGFLFATGIIATILWRPSSAPVTAQSDVH